MSQMCQSSTGQSDHSEQEEEEDDEEELDSDLLQKGVQDSTIENSDCEIYLKACQLVGVVPVSRILRNFNSPSLNLNHRGLGPRGAKALAIMLVSNTSITSLELEDNHIQAEGAASLTEMLRVNSTIQDLNMSNNHLYSTGAALFAKVLLSNTSLRTIKLSGNQFKDEDAKGFADVLSSNFRVKELDLSHNQFREKGGECLGQMLANNDGLEVINLSWNHLRMKGAVALCAGLRVNITLKILDLSWNGFGNEGALALGEALKFNNTLLQLDLSSNRITNEGAGMICKGLEANDTLKVLKLSNNPLTVEGAILLLTSVKNTHRSALEELNISNVLVNETFLLLLEKTCQVHLSLEVIFGGIGGFVAKKPKHRPDPMKVIQDYLDERKLRLWDFFKKIDKDGSMRVPVSDFRKAIQVKCKSVILGFQQSAIPLDRVQIEELVQRLDKDRTGIVDYRGLADTRKQMMRDHRRMLRKEESRQKKEKQKSDRVLKTFHNAVEAVTPRSSMVMSVGGQRYPDDSNSLHYFSTTPLSSWHNAVTRHCSPCSEPNMSSEHVRFPLIASTMNSSPESSLDVRSYSQPNLHSHSQNVCEPKSASASMVQSRSHRWSSLTPTARPTTPVVLTQSRPALLELSPQRKKNTTKRPSK
ncbi:LR74A protein, partial [Polypterus senegalus]